MKEYLNPSPVAIKTWVFWRCLVHYKNIKSVNISISNVVHSLNWYLALMFVWAVKQKTVVTWPLSREWLASAHSSVWFLYRRCFPALRPKFKPLCIHKECFVPVEPWPSGSGIVLARKEFRVRALLGHQCWGDLSMLISIGLYVFNVVCAARLAICRIALVS